MHGLTQQEAESRLTTLGKNEIVVHRRLSPLLLFASQFPTFINAILFAASIFSFLIGDLVDGVFILAILVLNATFGFLQQYQAEKALESLKTFVKPLSRVIRDGRETQIPTTDIVPGDVVILTEGERVPADGTLLLTHHIEIDESIITGESIPVMKKKHDLCLSGTLVTKGNGRILVEKTGMGTRFGQIAQSLAKIKPDKTPLEVRLEHLGKFLSAGAIVAALLLIPLGILQGKSVFPLLLLTVSVAVAAIPEGLPAVITVALALGGTEMAKRGAIVRKMHAVETLGAVQVLLIDKTGTLTQNVMRVRKFWVHDKRKDALLRACVLGNTATLVTRVDGGNDFDIVGDRTDGALLLFAHEHFNNIEAVQNEGKIIDEHVFDPNTKTVTTVWAKDGEHYVFVRGAPEAVLARSTLTKEETKRTKNTIDAYAKEGFRVIGFGMKTLPALRQGEYHAKQEPRQTRQERANLEKNLAFVGIVGIWDPPRREAKQAVEAAKRAGIRTIMVTGDNDLTALAIAKEVGLIEKEEDVITGEELQKLSDEELRSIAGKVRIFARTTPEDKLRLVELYKTLGFVVGVTGDGVNDALALKRADVGIAMGEKGTDVAREASDIVLTNDNFATIVSAIEEGRRIYQNIVKAVMYLLSGNLSELTFIIGASSFGFPTALLPTQILWINLVTDSLPALALASDVREATLLHNLPRDPKSPILSRDRIMWIGGLGLGVGVILLVVFALLLQGNGETYSRTIVFNLLVFLHLLLAFVVRGKTALRPNKFLIASVLFTLLLQLAITFSPTTQPLFHLGF